MVRTNVQMPPRKEINKFYHIINQATDNIHQKINLHENQLYGIYMQKSKISDAKHLVG